MNLSYTTWIGPFPTLMSLALLFAYMDYGKTEVLFGAIFCLILTFGCILIDLICHVLNQRKRQRSYDRYTND